MAKSFANDRITNLTMTGDLTKADFSGATLVGCTFEDCDLTGANLKGATLEACTLRDVDLSEADMRGCTLDTGCELASVTMSNTNLKGARVGDVLAYECDLTDANLEDVTFRTKNGSARVNGLRMTGGNLDGADLDGLLLRNSDISDVSLSGVRNAAKSRLSYVDLYGTVVPQRADGLLKLDEFGHVDDGRYDSVVSEMIGANFAASLTTMVDGKATSLYVTIDSPGDVVEDYASYEFLAPGDHEFVDGSGRTVEIDYEQAVRGQSGLSRDAVVPMYGYQVDRYGEAKANLKLMAKSGEIVDVRMPVSQRDLDTIGRRGSDLRLYASKDYVIEWQKDGFPARSCLLAGDRVARLADQAQMAMSRKKDLTPVAETQGVSTEPSEKEYGA